MMESVVAMVAFEKSQNDQCHERGSAQISYVLPTLMERAFPSWAYFWLSVMI